MRGASNTCEKTRILGTIHTFDSYYAQHPDSSWNRDRALGICNRADAAFARGSAPALLFNYREPIFRFQEGHQQLLIAALRGLTDEELARAIGLKLPATKKRWAAIFRRVGEIRPDLIPGLGDSVDKETRGPQRRHHLLAYLREHPEGLRPILKTASGGAIRDRAVAQK